MDTSSEEEEDGQISKLEEEEEKDRKLFGKKDAEDEPITIHDLEKCRLTRDVIAKHCMVPWFEDYVKGVVYNSVIILFLLIPWPRRMGSLSGGDGRAWRSGLPDMRSNECVTVAVHCGPSLDVPSRTWCGVVETVQGQHPTCEPNTGTQAWHRGQGVPDG
jgi:hypothetical protein